MEVAQGNKNCTVIMSTALTKNGNALEQNLDENSCGVSSRELRADYSSF